MQIEIQASNHKEEKKENLTDILALHSQMNMTSRQLRHYKASAPRTAEKEQQQH